MPSNLYVAMRGPATLRHLTLGATICLLLGITLAPASEATGNTASPTTSETQVASITSVTIALGGVCPADGHMYEGGSYAIHIDAIVDSGNFVNMNLFKFSKDGLPASPPVGPIVKGFNQITPPFSQSLIMYWEPSAGDAGTWEFCFYAITDLNAVDTFCAVVEVEVPGPDHVVWEPRDIRFYEGEGPFGIELQLSSYHSVGPIVGVRLPFILWRTAGAAFLAQPIAKEDVVLPPEYFGFDSYGFSFFGADSVSPDSLRISLINIVRVPTLYAGGPFTSSISVTLRDQEGIIRIDTTSLPLGLMYHWDAPPLGTITEILPTYSPGCFPVTIGPPCTVTLTGDANNNGALAASDIIWLVSYIFKGGATPLPCTATGDVNCDGSITSADIIYLVNHIFKSGSAPCDVCTLSPNTWTCL